MTLEDVRREMRERGGAIKAFALHWDTVEKIINELGVKGTSRSPAEYSSIPVGITVFDVPVVVVYEAQPEGVIV